jgi:hypothetical protein
VLGRAGGFSNRKERKERKEEGGQQKLQRQ